MGVAQKGMVSVAQVSRRWREVELVIKTVKKVVLRTGQINGLEDEF